MYYLYIDESGDAGDYLDSAKKVIPGSSKFYTLGGIIVEDKNTIYFKNAYDKIIKQYFEGISLPSNFKLHYHPLRQKRFPYDKLKDQDRYRLSEDIFDVIRNLDCSLLSVTLDLKIHCDHYPNPADPTAYTLLLILERFQYFVEEKQSRGKAIFEKFNAKMRKKAEIGLKWLQKIPTFPSPTNLDQLEKKIVYGDPVTEPILQFADFFAYTPWIRRTTNFNADEKWESLKDKYYNLNGSWLKTGHVNV